MKKAYFVQALLDETTGEIEVVILDRFQNVAARLGVLTALGLAGDINSAVVKAMAGAAEIQRKKRGGLTDALGNPL